VLGTLLFCLGIHSALNQITEGLDGVSLVAVVDDITIAGPLDKIQIALQRARDLLPPLGLQLSTSKSSILWPSLQLPTPSALLSFSTLTQIPVVRGALPLLGSMIGLDDLAISTFALDKANSHTPFSLALQHPRLRS
jgi:hypothetical protein